MLLQIAFCVVEEGCGEYSPGVFEDYLTADHSYLQGLKHFLWLVSPGTCCICSLFTVDCRLPYLTTSYHLMIMKLQSILDFQVEAICCEDTQKKSLGEFTQTES